MNRRGDSNANSWCLCKYSATCWHSIVCVEECIFLQDSEAEITQVRQSPLLLMESQRKLTGTAATVADLLIES